MDYNTSNTYVNSKIITNPLLKNKFEIEVDDEIVQINMKNISRFFSKLYILCPLANMEIGKDIYSLKISEDKWNDLGSKLVLSEASIKLVKNFNHGHNAIVVNSADIKKFNHFGYPIEGKIIVLPIFDVSYLNLQNYIKLYQGHYTLEDLYNVIVLNKYFSEKTKVNFNTQIYISEIIKNLDEPNYWYRKYNCLLNISKQFNSRRFRISKVHNIKDTNARNAVKDFEQESDKETGDYLKMIFNNKNFVDASSAIQKNGYKLYKISKKTDMSKDDINSLFSQLNTIQTYHLFSHLMVSKKYSHLVVNNRYLLNKMKEMIKYFPDLFRYLLGYSWLRFYMEESVKKTWIEKEDEFVFDINTASELPVYPFTLDDVKSNPYVPLMVDDNIIPKQNLGGISFFSSSNSKFNDTVSKGITDLNGFIKRMNLFISGNSSNNIFANLDWNEVGMGISGSIMAACLQERHPLLALFKGKNNYNNSSDFDLDYNRYFNEYYAEADVDVMIKSSHPLDFIRKSKTIFNQVVVNVCGFNPSNAEPSHVKMKTIRTIFLFVSKRFIQDNLVNDSISYEFIISNLKEENIIQLFVKQFDKKIKNFYKEMLQEYSKDEISKIKSQHPELFEDNETVYQIVVSDNNKNIVDVETSPTEDDNKDELLETLDGLESNKVLKHYEDLGVNITYKVKISSIHIQRQLELFSFFGEDFFSLVSKFHMPCVRAYYDGTNTYLTPSCISAHMTYMNLDYKYFAGSKDPIEIILKYRMRGFGTFLNKDEINKVVKYITEIPFWNNLYSINLTKSSTIKDNLGSLNYSHKLFHPRLFNAELFDFNAPYVNINDGYNNIDKLTKLNQDDCVNWMIKQFDSDFIKSEFNTTKFKTINKDGYIKPFEKWVIDAYLQFNKSIYYSKLSKKSTEDKDKKMTTIKYVGFDEEMIESIEEEGSL